MSKVLVMDSTYDTCQEAVEMAFLTFPLDVRGKKVAVKTNALRASDPEREAITTHYSVVKAVIDSRSWLMAVSTSRGESGLAGKQRA